MKCPDYTQPYYAVFFEDPDGNRFRGVLPALIQP